MRVISTRQDFLEMLIELIGIKSGLLLDKEHLICLLDQDYHRVGESGVVLGGASKWWVGDANAMIGIRAEELEADFLLVMQGIGAILDNRPALFLFLEHFKSRYPIEEVTSRVNEFVESIAKGIVPDGEEEFLAEYQKRDILNHNIPQIRDWDGMISLSDLFGSEEIPEGTPPENYFDQRFIDYLNTQSGDLKRIHWRQFEYFTGEFFRRNGYHVTITPPRGDGGIDVIAEKPDNILGPDLIVVQCRRYADDHPVSIDEIKAFWTSVDEHKATKGLIVTTSHLTTGGHSFIKARNYRLQSIEGDNVKMWLISMSSRPSV